MNKNDRKSRFEDMKAHLKKAAKGKKPPHKEPAGEKDAKAESDESPEEVAAEAKMVAAMKSK